MVLKVGTKVGTFIGCKRTKSFAESKNSKRPYGNHQSTMIDIWCHLQRVSVMIYGLLGDLNKLSSVSSR